MKPVIALAVFLMLAACTTVPTPPVPVVTDSPSVTPADPDPDLDADTLFVITATTTAADGSEVALTMIGHANQPVESAGREAIAQSYIEQCAALGGGVVLDRDGGLDPDTLIGVGSTLMVIDTLSTPAATALSGGVDLLLGNAFYTVVASGDGLGNPYQDGCNSGYQLTSTGSVTSITNYETGSPTPDLAQWRSGRYGFSIAFDSTAVLSNCSIVLTQLAIDSDVAAIDGWYPDAGSEHECAIGYRGA